MPSTWNDTEDKKLLMACMKVCMVKPNEWDRIAQLLDDGKTGEAVRQRYGKLRREADLDYAEPVSSPTDRVQTKKRQRRNAISADDGLKPDFGQTMSSPAARVQTKKNDRRNTIAAGETLKSAKKTTAVVAHKTSRGKRIKTEVAVEDDDEADEDEAKAKLKTEVEDANTSITWPDTPGPKGGEDMEAGSEAETWEGIIQSSPPAASPPTPGPESSDGAATGRDD